MSNKSTPATTCPAYDFMLPSWEKINAVLGGTRAMRDAGRLYLPQHDNETDTAYYDRLQKSTLFNMASLTLESWVGRPFSELVTLEPDTPPEIVDLADNIDTLGNNLHVFGRNWFRDGLAKGYSHVLVDMPRRPEGVVRTLRDDLQDGVRPYWVHMKPESLFFADAEVIGGKEVLTEIRFLETVTEREGFALVEHPRVRQMVLTDAGVSVIVWEEVRSKGKRKKEWGVVDEYVMGIDRIPLVTFYADRTEFMVGKSPIEDLVDLNVAHWQSTSDQRACLTTARFPILACSGASDESQELVVGPNRWIYMPDPQARAYYVEHSGKAIGVGKDELDDLVRQMGEYGAEFLKKRPSRETASARQLDSSEATSALQDATWRFIDAVNNALALTAKWLNLPDGGTVSIETDFAGLPIGGESLRVLIEARKNGDISRQALIRELKRFKVLDENFDEDAEDQALEAELGQFRISFGQPDMVNNGGE